MTLVTDISPAPMTAAEALRLVDLGERARPLSGAAVGRRTTARGHRARDREAPAVLLCDEPTGALDITTGVVVLEALQRINTELGTTTVVITHNAAIAGMADRVIRLADGRVVGDRGAVEPEARATRAVMVR